MKHEAMLTRLRAQLLRHEGMRLKPYMCPSGKLTIGIGRNLDDKGITRDEALLLLDNDIAECVADLRSIFPKFHTYSVERQTALCDLRFNLGASGFRQFRKMIRAVHDEDWQKAATETVASKWYYQVQPERSNTIYRQLGDG